RCHPDLPGARSGRSTVDGDDPAAAGGAGQSLPGQPLRIVRPADDTAVPAAGGDPGARLESTADTAAERSHWRRPGAAGRVVDASRAAAADQAFAQERPRGSAAGGPDYFPVLIGFSGYHTSISGLRVYSASSLRSVSQASTFSRRSSLTEPRRAGHTKP